MANVDEALLEKAFASVRAAIEKFNAGKAQDEPCVFCATPLIVEGLPPGGPFSAWMVHCRCGKSNTTFKGI